MNQIASFALYFLKLSNLIKCKYDKKYAPNRVICAIIFKIFRFPIGWKVVQNIFVMKCNWKVQHQNGRPTLKNHLSIFWKVVQNVLMVYVRKYDKKYVPNRVICVTLFKKFPTAEGGTSPLRLPPASRKRDGCAFAQFRTPHLKTLATGLFRRNTLQTKCWSYTV